MKFAHVLRDGDDDAVTVFLQQYVIIEETNYKMLLEPYNKRMNISEVFEDTLRNLRQKRADINHPVNEPDESQKLGC